MKFISKDSKKFLGVSDNKVCLTETEYEWKQLNLSEGYFNIVPLENDILCITPLSIEDGKELELKKIDPTNQSQLWKIEEDYLINRLERTEGIKKMCIDVCCENKETGTYIIIYHKKNNGNLKNQQWDIKNEQN